ncbi:hypothetical protein [Bacillus cereus]|nr:Uncharacterised protein [Streptococcus pneumoniae]
MSYEEFIDLQEGDTVEDSDGVLGKVSSIDILSGDVWVNWEDVNHGETYWSSYKEINKY